LRRSSRVSLITFSLWTTRPTRHDTPESYPQDSGFFYSVS